MPIGYVIRIRPHESKNKLIKMSVSINKFILKNKNYFHHDGGSSLKDRLTYVRRIVS